MSHQYALCKHGPWHGSLRCGFAHGLDELALRSSIPTKLWQDASEQRFGHSAPDIWFGQEYAPVQLQRVLMYIANHDGAYPEWIYMLVWFYGSFEGALSDTEKA